MWRLRVVHTTGYAYKSPVTASYNEVRLTPPSNTRQNVVLNVQKLKGATPIIDAAVAQGKLRIVGAIYRLSDGHVELVA